MDQGLSSETILVASSVNVFVISLLVWMGCLAEKAWQAGVVVIKSVICQQGIWQKRGHLW